MADTCRFLEHNNIAKFFSIRSFYISIFYQTETIFFLRMRLHTLQKEKLQIVKK